MNLFLFVLIYLTIFFYCLWTLNPYLTHLLLFSNNTKQQWTKLIKLCIKTIIYLIRNVMFKYVYKFLFSNLFCHFVLFLLTQGSSCQTRIVKFCFPLNHFFCSTKTKVKILFVSQYDIAKFLFAWSHLFFKILIWHVVQNYW